MFNKGHVTGEQLATLPLIQAVYVDPVPKNYLSWVKSFSWFPRATSCVLVTYVEMFRNSVLPHT
jgi:hypothetical protein